MLQIVSLQLLYKQSHFLDGLLKPMSHVQLIINGKTKLQTKPVLIDNQIARWPNQLPKINLIDPKLPIYIDFIFFKNQTVNGRAKSIIYPGISKKDCLDVINQYDYHFIGKFFYEAHWHQNIQSQYYQQQNVNNQLNNRSLIPIGMNYQNNKKQQSNSQSSKKNKKIRKVYPQDQFCGCFVSRSSKSAPKFSIPENYLIFYNKNQLISHGAQKKQPLKVNFYSSRYQNK